METAKNIKEELAVLRELCDVAIKGMLTRSSGSFEESELQGLRKLKENVDKAEADAGLCNGVGFKQAIKTIKQFILTRKICKEIAAVRKNVLDFSTTNNVVLTSGLHVSTSAPHQVVCT